MNDSEKVFQNLKQDVSAYMELKLELLKLNTYERTLELLKLNTYERTGKVIGLLSYGLILLFLAFFAVLFIFLALGFFLGEILDVPGSGFAIVALLYVAIIWIITKNEAKIRTKILNLVIAALAANDDKQNTKDDESSATDAAGKTVG